MARLAFLGGKPVMPAVATGGFGDIWPPVKQSTEEKLTALYRSREWSTFHSSERRFADAFARHHGAEYGIFMANGTVTLQCALAACDVGPGDEVIVPSLTWYATAMAAHYVGATPVFVDIDNNTLCIDPASIRDAITERTKAIIPVHLYGAIADMESIMAIADEYQLKVIEDCAHMHGGRWKGQGVGTLGHIGSFSFQHSKTMASAEGGICITNDAELADRIFRMSHIGYGVGQMQGKASNSLETGLVCHNFRATAFQAVILEDQLSDLNDLLGRYNDAVRYLQERLSKSTNIRFQKQDKGTDMQGYFGWLMIFDHPDYADIPIEIIKDAMMQEGLNVMLTWNPVYKFVLFNLHSDAYRISKGSCPVTESISKRTLWVLHAYLGMGSDYIEKIGDVIEKVTANIDQLREYASQKDSSSVALS